MRAVCWLCIVASAVAFACPQNMTNSAVPVKEIRKMVGLDKEEKHISVQPEEPFVVMIQSNPTTGYSWTMNQSSDGVAHIRVLSCVYQPNNGIDKRMVGVGGMESWILRASPNTGIYTLTFDYVRPWELDQPPATRRQLIVTQG